MRDRSAVLLLVLAACQASSSSGGLDARHRLWDFYADWRDGIRGDTPPQSAVRHVLHDTVDEANVEWIAWLGSLEAKRP